MFKKEICIAVVAIPDELVTITSDILEVIY